jgi:membrane associated rhomboid family serine protease
MFEEFKNAFQRHNNGHVQLILINVVVFVMMTVLRLVLTWTGGHDAFALIHDQFSIPPLIGDFVQRPWTMITYAFAHDLTGILHIFFNMLALYWFGRLFVEYLGSDKVIAVYVLGALAGAVAYLGVYNLVPYYAERFPVGMVGASAAVYAVVVAVATLLPDYTFFLLFLGPVRIKYIAAVYIVISLVGAIGANEGGNVAHLGGALIGFVYIKQLQAGNNWGRWITSILDWFRRLSSARRHVKVTYRKSGESRKGSPRPPSISQDEIDTILDKISDGGYESLTKEEKEKLFNASKK